MPHCDERRGEAAQKQSWEAPARPPQLALPEHLRHGVPALGVIPEQSLQLEKGAQGQKQVEDLVTVAHHVALAREEALGDGAGEEDGGQQETRNLEGVEGQRGLPRPGDGGQPVGHGADVQQVRQRGGDQLADLALPRVRPAVPELGEAAAGAREPGEESSTRQEQQAHAALLPGRLRRVEVMAERATVLVGGHAHVVQEEEEVMRAFGVRLQEVSCRAEGHVGEGGHQENRQRERGGVQGVPQVTRLGPPAEQDGGNRQQVGPHVEGFVVSLEEAEEVATPVLQRRPVAGQDVRLSEEHGDLGGIYGGTGRRDGRGYEVGEAGEVAEVVIVQGHGAEPLQHLRHSSAIGAQKSERVGPKTKRDSPGADTPAGDRTSA